MGYRETSSLVEAAGHSPIRKRKIKTFVASYSTKSPSSSSPSSSSSSSSSDRNISSAEENGVASISRKFNLLDFGTDLSCSDCDDDTDSSSFLTRRENRGAATIGAKPPLEQLTPPTTIHTLGHRNRIRCRPVSSLSSSTSSSVSFQSSSTNSLSSSVSSSRTYGTSGNEDIDYQIKNTNDALVGSISAAINFCRHAGVPKPSILQLERNLEMKRHFAVLSRIQNYIGCIKSESREEAMTKIHLVATSWEALCRCKALEYKLAYKNVAHLRNTSAVIDDPSAAKILSSFSLTTTSSSAASSSLSRTSTGITSESDILRAIQLQINLAEQVTACQKKLYLVRRWQRQILS
mmetsp:Transcript_22535/g.53190  ORF Transcript_22535/g.53190 Transcript_22535/m.53190 type:complete len:349 (-) Transcript_22535:227-1273(-)|eukprot:CAMPEP_0172389046 /NCGR_PEP_ID=MMETSP1061-20121228/6024_1 /TAXON_ID=37318 /ORGANISM="Pseudo-nitzschia pungens, Strain cf. pungens" /LENGTH=348 /DNA_ID=CAMNT_0013119093 /DNA_START=217 /DNA_END=1263 /DNA_ORIENTATION=+